MGFANEKRLGRMLAFAPAASMHTVAAGGFSRGAGGLCVTSSAVLWESPSRVTIVAPPPVHSPLSARNLLALPRNPAAAPEPRAHAPHTSPRSSRPPPEPRRPEYHANVGSAIEVLREDYPRMLATEPRMHIYAENIVLTDRRSIDVRGKDAYHNALWSLRFHARIFLKNTHVSIQSMYHDDAEGRLYVRWRLVALPRIPGWNPHAPWILDGMSRYSFDSSGLVSKHDIDPSVRNGTSLRPVFERILSLGVINVGQPVGQPVGASLGSKIGIAEPCAHTTAQEVSPLQHNAGAETS